jgi:hypothetical protein
MDIDNAMVAECMRASVHIVNHYIECVAVVTRASLCCYCFVSSDANNKPNNNNKSVIV